jgi:alcohol dehydrogenase class IV
MVTDPGVRDMGFIERIEKILKSRNTEVIVFDQVEPDPSRETAHNIYLMAQDFKPDVFIGLGGGSSIDAGKAAWVFYEHPDIAEMHLFDVQKAALTRVLRNKARYIAIPTTSGTGSEVTGVAVITARDIEPPLKVGFRSPEMKPDIAIADPELAATMPPTVTANTGFDALVHAIECYVLTPPSDMVDPLCICAAETLWKWLPEAVANGGNMLARDKIHTAALQAGMAFSNGRLGSIHLLSHEISAIFGVAHGRANAFMLCPVFAYIYPTHTSRLASLCDRLGFSGKDDRTKITSLLDGLDELKQNVGIPLAMSDEITENVFRAQLEPLAKSYSDYVIEKRLAALTPEQCRADGWPVSEEDVKTLYSHAWNGTRVHLE